MSFTDFFSSNLRTEFENEILSGIQRTVSFPEIWVYSKADLVGKCPTWAGQVWPFDESQSQKMSFLEKNYFGILRRASEIKSLYVASLTVSSKISMADNRYKTTTEFVYAFIKAKFQLLSVFFPNVIRFTCTVCASICSGIQLPFLNSEGTD